MDHLKKDIEAVGSKAKKENLDSKIQHKIPVGGSPHKVSDLKDQPELSHIKKPQEEVIAPHKFHKETKGKPTTQKSPQKPTTQKEAQVDKNVKRSANEDWGKLNFF